MDNNLDRVKKEIDNSGVCFLLGNGLNLFAKDKCSGFSMPSWGELISIIAKDINFKALRSLEKNMKVYSRISYPEIFTILLRNTDMCVKSKVCKIIAKHSPTEIHSSFVKYCIKNRSPIITTNYDFLLEKSVGILSEKNTKEKIHKTYPITRCYTLQELFTVNPMTDFAIWHLQGYVDRRESIRLGFIDYANQLVWFKKQLPTLEDVKSNRIKADSLFDHSLLAPFFKKKLCIIGSRLDQSELVLRWLLLRRSLFWKYFDNNSCCNTDSGWFIYKDKKEDNGLNFFLNSIGITPIPVNEYSDIYSSFLC